MIETQAASVKHTFLTYFIPWDQYKHTYNPTIYNSYTEQYIELTKNKHNQLSADFYTDYQFINDAEYCISLFDKYNLDRFGPNDLFNIKFLLLEEYFQTYDTITYIDFDVVQVGSPTQEQVEELKTDTCAIRYTPGSTEYLVHKNVKRLCEIFSVPYVAENIFQNNNGVFTISKEEWKKLDYLNSLKKVYNTIDKQFAFELCDESLFNFIRLLTNVPVKRLNTNFNTFARNREEYIKICKNDFRMIHFSKDTGKEVLNELLFDPNSILY